MADSSSKIIKALFSSNKGGGNKTNFDIGKINPRILKILGVSEFDIEDEQEYLSLLKEKMLLIIMGKSKLSREDEELITEELKRLRTKKFPKKKITADSFKKGTAVGMNFGLKRVTGGVTPKQLLLPPSVDKMSGKSDIQEIIDALSSIIEQLTLFNNLTENEQERDRRGRENRRRKEREGELEKGFDGVMKAAEKVIAPVKSILDRIINFLVMTLIGRSLVLILRWFGDPENKKKVEAIGRFLGDHWPKLLALFIAFGTGLGGFVRGLIGVVIKGTGALIKGAVALAARAGIKGAGGALKFLGGPKGKLIGAGLELGAVALGTVALSKGLENFGGIGGEKSETTTAKFSGGGFANLKNLFGNIGGFFNGMVNGPKGTDKVPAMLTDGEFVMSRGAVAKYGVDTLESMNAAGGGNNKPKVVEGTTYAAGGGLVGYAGNMIKHHEALAALSPNTGGGNKLPDLVLPSSPKYKTLSNDTKIYPYLDSVNVPTIGWGATYYDKISNGKKPVKITDPPITKKVADNLLNKHLAELIPRAKSQLPLWDNMSPQQQGTIISFLYNAGPNAINLTGPYPKFSKALIDGNMKEAAAQVNRSGPPASRINEEKKLLTSGPLDLKKATGKKPKVAVKPKQEKKPSGILENISSGFRSIFTPPVSAKERIVNPPVNPIGTQKPSVKAKIAPIKSKPGVTPPIKSPVKVEYKPAGGGMEGRSGNGSKPSTATPKVPQFSSASSSRSRRRTASTYGIG